MTIHEGHAQTHRRSRQEAASILPTRCWNGRPRSRHTCLYRCLHMPIPDGHVPGNQTCVRMHKRVYVSASLRVCTHTCACVRMCTPAHVGSCVRSYACTCLHTRASTHAPARPHAVHRSLGTCLRTCLHPHMPTDDCERARDDGPRRYASLYRCRRAGLQVSAAAGLTFPCPAVV